MFAKEAMAMFTQHTRSARGYRAAVPLLAFLALLLAFSRAAAGLFSRIVRR